MTPDEFDMHMKLKLPFEITPERYGYGFVCLDGGFVKIHRGNLQTWLRSIFEKVDRRVATSRGEVYTLKYIREGYGCAHTIKAFGNTRTISFDFVPALEFPGSQWPLATPPIPAEIRNKWPWFAIPQKYPEAKKNQFTFMVCAPTWERERIKDLDNFKNVLRLMKGLRDAEKKELPKLSSYMLKTVLLHQLDLVDWQQDLGTLLVAMWAHLVDHLHKERLAFFLADGHNLFSRMSPAEVVKCYVTANEILTKLREAQKTGSSLLLEQLFNVKIQEFKSSEVQELKALLKQFHDARKTFFFISFLFLSKKR